MAPAWSTSDEHLAGPVPGGWYGSSLTKTPQAWRVPLPAQASDDLLRAAESLVPGDLGILGADPLQHRPRVSARTWSLVGDLQRRLAGQPGLVVLTGFPVHEDRKLMETAYVVLMMLVGQPVLQRLDEELIVRLEANQPAASAPGAGRSGTTHAMPPHVDRAADVVGLLCVRPAASGGVSFAVSSKTVFNIMLERHPELLAALCRPVPVHVSKHRPPDRRAAPDWCELPMFSRVNGHFASYFNRIHIEATQEYPDAPRITAEQAAAVDAVEEVGRLPELRLEMPLASGDLQLVNNLSVAHARTAYSADARGAGRLLLRMHAAFGGSPELPPGYATIFGSSTAGTYRGGLWRTAEVRKRFGIPLPMAPVRA